MATAAIPIVVEGIGALLGWLGIGALTAITAAAVIDLAKNSNVNSKMKQWATDHAQTVADWLQKKDPREPTPFTHPPLFSQTSISSQKVHEKKGVGEIWKEDMLHGNEFEVYLSRKDFEKGKRNRVVSLDGRQLPKL